MVAKLHDTCTVAGCGKKHAARGYCNTHYRLFMKHGDPINRFHRTTCTIEGCGGAHQARGYCHKHYAKYQKYGDAQFQINADHGDPLGFLRRQLAARSDECANWPFSTYGSGYGSIWFEGKLTGAHRLVCRLAHGDPSRPNLHAAHRCGNKLCVNPQHLRWTTALENEHDKAMHGTRRFAA